MPAFQILCKNRSLKMKPMSCPFESSGHFGRLIWLHINLILWFKTWKLIGLFRLVYSRNFWQNLQSKYFFSLLINYFTGFCLLRHNSSSDEGGETPKSIHLSHQPVTATNNPTLRDETYAFTILTSLGVFLGGREKEGEGRCVAYIGMGKEGREVSGKDIKEWAEINTEKREAAAKMNGRRGEEEGNGLRRERLEKWWIIRAQKARKSFL